MYKYCIERKQMTALTKNDRYVLLARFLLHYAFFHYPGG
jgi:hypothetical protein